MFCDVNMIPADALAAFTAWASAGLVLTWGSGFACSSNDLQPGVAMNGKSHIRFSAREDLASAVYGLCVDDGLFDAFVFALLFPQRLY